MKTLPRILLILFVALFALGNRGCVTPDTVIVPEGPQAAALSKAKDEQIVGLLAQVKAEITAREMEQALASKAASSVVGMLKAREYLEASLPSEAIKAEGDLALTRLPKDDPAETVKALERVVAIVTGQRDEAQRLYREANAATALERAAKEAKDAEIAKRDQDLKARDGEIGRLAAEAIKEREKHAGDVKDALAKKDKELADYKSEQASKERRWLTNATRLAALGLIVAGAIALAAFKMVGVGSGLAGAGVLVGLISIGIETLTSQPWWPYLCGTVFVGVVLAAIWGVWELWKKHQLDVKKTQAIQDLRDEAAAKGDTKVVDALDEHLEYRMGPDGSFWQKEQVKTEVALGLVDPKGEAALAGSAVPKS